MMKEEEKTETDKIHESEENWKKKRLKTNITKKKKDDKHKEDDEEGVNNERLHAMRQMKLMKLIKKEL